MASIGKRLAEGWYTDPEVERDVRLLFNVVDALKRSSEVEESIPDGAPLTRQAELAALELQAAIDALEAE